MAAALGTVMHARLKTDPRSVLREFLRQLKPPALRSGVLDALLIFAPTEVAARDPTIGTVREGPVAPAQRARVRWPAAKGLLAAVVVAAGIATIQLLPERTTEARMTVVATPAPPVPAAVTAQASVPAVAATALEQTPAPKKKVRNATSASKPTVLGVLVIGGPGAQRCEIKVDGTSFGFAPKRLELEAGTHQVELITPTGEKIGPRKIDLTERHTEHEPYRWLVD